MFEVETMILKCPICKKEFDILGTDSMPPQIDIKFHEYDNKDGKYIGESKHIFICSQCDAKLAEAIKNNQK